MKSCIESTSVLIAMKKAEWQKALFGASLRRMLLTNLVPVWPCSDLRIRVHRNHSFEHIAVVIDPFLNYAGLNATWRYSDYDDSFLFEGRTDTVDVELIWIDLDRYTELSEEELRNWLNLRVGVLRKNSKAPIIVCALPRSALSSSVLPDYALPLPGVLWWDESTFLGEASATFYDERTHSLSGTRLGNAGCLWVARELGAKLIPAMIRPRLKAIVLDLDNTLYEGVLGEDGHDVLLTAGHKALQQYLVELQSSGMFLAVASKNEQDDVFALFNKRSDFPLRLDHFSVLEVSWDKKSAAICRIANELRIGPDSIVFVDDNPGELAEAVEEISEIKTIHAQPDAMNTLRALQYFPNLWSPKISVADRLRNVDSTANRERANLLKRSSTSEEYLQTLQVKVKIDVSNREQIPRLAELSNKTNQFNFRFQRVSEAELDAYMCSEQSAVVGLSLSDRLSDSGVVGLLVGCMDCDTLLIKELVISCRALGRRLETIMIISAIYPMMQKFAPEDVQIGFKTGPRNGPARKWLEEFIGSHVETNGYYSIGQYLKEHDLKNELITIEH